MSLPSIAAVAAEKQIDLSNATAEEQEEVLVEAMRRDLSLAVSFLHKKAHEADDNSGEISWVEDPKSELGKQLIRIHAGDALRMLASKHFCHSKSLSFTNCCGGIVGTTPTKVEMFDRQIKSQVGPIAYADC